jgi:hypothetical protein
VTPLVVDQRANAAATVAWAGKSMALSSSMRPSGIVLLCACLGSAAGRADESGGGVPATLLPQDPKDACTGRCFGYAASTNTWLCGRMESSSDGMGESTRCTLQVIRRGAILAEATVYRSDTLTGLDDLIVPLQTALALAPPGLAPLRTLELPPNVETALLGSHHNIRLEAPEPRRIDKGARKVAEVRLTAICNRTAEDAKRDQSAARWKSRPRPAPDVVPAHPTPPKEALLFSEESYGNKKATYTLQIGSVPSAVVLIEDRLVGSFEMSLGTRQAHVLDLERCSSPH